MIRLSEKSRKLLRMVYRGLGVTAVSFSLQACNFLFSAEYGMPAMYGPGPDPYMDVIIQGVVHDKKTCNPIPDIRVSVKDLDTHFYTGKDGYFYIYVPEQESYKLKFENVAGAKNGSYQIKKMKISLADARQGLGAIHLESEDGNK
jgi:putative lipoprotein (rSAM/lipoprotein system)